MEVAPNRLHGFTHGRNNEKHRVARREHGKRRSESSKRVDGVGTQTFSLERYAISEVTHGIQGLGGILNPGGATKI